MLVRATFILLCNPFPPPPIKPIETPSRLVHSGENLGNIHQNDEPTPDDTVQSANNHDIEEYDIVTVQDETNITSTTTINVSLEEEESNNRMLLQQQTNLISLPEEDNTTTTTDTIDRSSAEHDIIMHSTTHDDSSNSSNSSSINVKDNSPSVMTLLLDKPIPTYYTTPLSSLTEDNIAYDNDNSKVIYYKRCEDFYPQIIKNKQQQQQQQQIQQLSEEENLSPVSNNNNQQNRRTSIYNVLGKAAIRIHPGPASIIKNDNSDGGIPVFKPSKSTSSTLLADKIKPKTVFKRIKTLVKNKKRSSL